MSRMISQTSFARGLQTLIQPFAQGGKGLVSRVSNLFFTVRGALKTIDGVSTVQSLTKAAGGALTGPIYAIFLSKSAYGLFGYGALHDDATGIALRAPVAGVIQQYTVTGIIKNVLLAGACGGGSTSVNATGALANATPNGGVSGRASVLPQAVPFQSRVLILLGNGVTPEVYDPTTETRTPLTNTFTTSYPTWISSSIYDEGDVITPTVLNGAIYICAQGGTSGATQPTFPTTVDVTVRDGQVIWRNLGTDTSAVPPGGAHGASHGGAMWIFNTRFSNSADGLDGPSSLRMSDVGNRLSWNPLNQIFIGKDDQQEGMGLASFSIGEQGIVPTGQLVAFKQFSTYSILGLMGSPNFAINRVKTDMGCIAPRTIEFVSGRGIIRLTHRGVAVFDGINDYVISDPVRPYLFDDDTLDIRGMDMDYAYFSKATQVADPLLYLLAIPVITNQTNTTRGNLRRILIFDVLLKLWTVVNLPFAISALYQAIVPGSVPLTVEGDYTGGAIRRMFCGDPDWETDGPIQWSFRPQEIFSNAATRRVYVRQLLLRCFGVGVPTTAAFRLNESTTEDPNSATPPLTVPMSNSPTRDGTRFESIAPVHRTVLNATADISGTGRIEIDAVEWEVTDKHAAVPLQMV